MVNKHDFLQILGAQYITDDHEILDGFSKDHSFTLPKKPALVVRPGTPEEIVRLVKLANEKSIKLIPVSSGPPRFRGDSVPAVDNAVIVDLSYMKKIMWINRRNRVALVEPGVTFDELSAALQKEGLRCMMPLLPRANKSIVGAFMEREPFTIPKYAWDLGDPIASSELILGDGYKMRTGGGAGPAATLEAQREIGGAHKLPFSPANMDVRRIAQGSHGSFAICSWLALRCELLPEHEKVYFAGSDNIEELIKASYRFLYLRLTDEMYIVNNLNFACLLEKDPDRIETLRQILPNWILVLSIGGYGELSKEQFDYKEGDLLDEANAVSIKLVTEIGGIDEFQYREKVTRNVSDDPYWKMRRKGDCREIFFLNSLSKAPDFIQAVWEAADRNGFEATDIGAYFQMVIQGTTCHMEFDLYTDPEDTDKIQSFYDDLSKKIFEMGGYYSRPYGAWADLIYPHSETFVKYARGLKRIFDPNLVMNPEKLCFKEM